MDLLTLLLFILIIAAVFTVIAVSSTKRHRRRWPTEPGEAPRRMNGLAIAAFIVVFFSSLIGLILGHVALSQIKVRADGGHGLALAAVLIGWPVTLLGIAVVTFRYLQFGISLGF